MKNFNFVVFAMIFLATLHQKAFSQSSDLKIYDGHGAQISSDTIVPINTYQIGVDLQNNTMDYVKVSNIELGEQMCEGFNYQAAERLGMDPITPGMLVKMLKDTAHCKVKYLNVGKDQLLNSEIEPGTSNIVWVKMKENLSGIPYVVYISPYNGLQAVLFKLPCFNPQADLREAIPEEKLADNDDIYFQPEKEGITEVTPGTATANATAEAKVIVEYVPQGATNFQQYNQPCGCMQPYYQQPYYQPYCYTNYPQWFVGIQFIFSFQWGGQQYYAYDPQDQQVQNVVNNYNTNNNYYTTIINNYGVSDTSSTDTGGATNGTDGDPTDTGGASDGSGLADNSGAENGSGKQSNLKHVVETLEDKPIGNLQTNQVKHPVSTLDDGATVFATTGSQTLGNLDVNPVSINVSHPVETLDGGGQVFNGVNHTATNFDNHSVLASNSGNQNVSYSGNSQNGLMNMNQQNGNGGYTASNGTFNPQANYSQGVHTYSNGSQLQTTYTNPQGQMYGQNAGYPGSNPVAVNTNGNVGNGGYQNYNPNHNNTVATGPNTIGTNGYVNSIPLGNISYNPQQSGNVQQYIQPAPRTNFATGNTGFVNYQPSRNLNFSQAPKLSFNQSGQKTFQMGRGSF